jgi:sugar fermentation stimulation protein A
MKFTAPLEPGTLVQRYKRFLADITLADGTTVTATCPNTGAMIGLKQPGQRVWVSTSDKASRKYRHTWELVEHDLGKGPKLVGINTGHPNRLVEEALLAGRIVSLSGYPSLKREQRYGVNSRIDLLLEDPKRGRAYVEVKNVHMSRRAGLAEFPDSVTERGTKHLGELASMVREGHRAVMVYLIQRSDVARFTLARDVDPIYGAAYDEAVAAGVEVLALRCKLSPRAITVDRAVAIV